MKILLPIILLISACSTNPQNVDPGKKSTDSLELPPSRGKEISDPANTLNGKTESLELEYIVWGCACANWITPADYEKYQDDNLSKHSIFIEPANKELELPLYFDPWRHLIKVTGQFYVRPDYPKGTIQEEEIPGKAKVFRYTKMKVFKRDIAYLQKDDTTLNLTYNAISCPCAQWSPINSAFDSTREYYFLEPATDKLINADTLWDGNTLPLEIQVTGQIVSLSGYPTGYNPVKGNPKAEKVFRYTKIKILNYDRNKNINQ